MTRWVLANVVRFAAVWLCVGTVFVFVMGVDTVNPIGLLLELFVSVFTAFVALILFSPVLLLWLALFLVVSRLLARWALAVPIVVAPVLWLVFAHVDPPEIRYVALVGIILFGLVAVPPPGSRRVGPWRARSTSSS